MTNVAADRPVDDHVDELLRQYHDHRRREDMWRIPQLLLALATPILILISLVFALGGGGDPAVIAGALALITGVGAALLGVEVWRQHRMAIGIGNSIRTDHPTHAVLLVRDPL